MESGVYCGGRCYPEIYSSEDAPAAAWAMDIPAQAKALIMSAPNQPRAREEQIQSNDNATADVDHAFLTPEELSRRWRNSVDVQTLRNWRASKPKLGPAYHRIGRAVLYRMDHVMAWEEENLQRTKPHRAGPNVSERDNPELAQRTAPNARPLPCKSKQIHK
jgi:hypothetical protein